MQVSLLQKNSDKTAYSFIVKGADNYLMNSVRRSIISLVPTMAIEEVEFRKNSAILYDEVLAHRLGLVPLKTDLKHYEMIKSPEDAESMKCVLKLTLKAKGPGTVYSGDIKSSDNAVTPVYDTIPLVKMIKGQELELEARAILGIGKDHMKWSPGIVYFKNMLSLDIKDKADVEKIKKKVPENVGLKFSGSKISVDEDKLALSSFFDAYANEEAIDGIKVTLVPDNFIFNVESFGQLSVKEMVQKGIEILQEKLNELNDKISK